MAMSWDGSSSVLFPLSAITAFPFSFFAWGEHNSTATTGVISGIGNVSSADYSWANYFRGDIGGDPIACRRVQSSGSNSPQSAAYSVNTTYAVGLVAAAANDVRLYVDQNKYTSTSSVGFPTDADRMECAGRDWLGGHEEGMVGRGQSYAVWSALLNDDEMAALAKGFSPRLIRPSALEAYWPAIRAVQDIVGGGSPSTRGTITPTPHLRSYGF